MKTDEMKTVANALNELGGSHVDFLHSLEETIKEAKAAKKLFKNGEKPWLIKLGLALILFPDPTITDVIGSILVAAGTVQEGIRRRALHVEDIPKTFQSVMRELQAAQESINRKLC